MSSRARAESRLRIGIVSLVSPNWLAGQALTDVMVEALWRAHDPAREQLYLIAPDEAAPVREGVELLRVPPAASPTRIEKAVRASLNARDRLPWLPGEWSIRRRLGLTEPSNPIHVARLAGVDVALPLTHMHAPRVGVRCIGWVPDFQHRSLPELFSAGEVANRSASQAALAAGCVRMILSSRAVARQFAEIYPEEAPKARVASFPSQFAFRPPAGDARAVLARYGLPEKFALVVNQFWAHKNHGVVLDALQLLTARGRGVPIVLAGALVDYRDPQGRYLSELLQKIARAGLSRDLFLLGRVPFPDLVGLLRCATVVVQPSRFEGWNTTVQDALALGRPLLCSDIEVHREQARGGEGFFGCGRPDELADLLAERWETCSPGPDLVREAIALTEEIRFAAGYGEALIRTCREAAAL